MNTNVEWSAYLAELSRILLSADARLPQEQRRFTAEEQSRGTLARPGASPEQVEAAEQRLGVKLPPSYRAFLEASNGFPALGTPTMPDDFWSTEEVGFLRDKFPEMVEIWTDGGYDKSMSPLKNSIMLAEHEWATDVLLCPDLPTGNGEIECWKLASWIPGEKRFPNFGVFMYKELKQVWSQLIQDMHQDSLKVVPFRPPFGLFPAEIAIYLAHAILIGLHSFEQAIAWARGQVQGQPRPNPYLLKIANEEHSNVYDLLLKAGANANHNSALQALLRQVQAQLKVEPDWAYVIASSIGHLTRDLLSPGLRQRFNDVYDEFSATGSFAEFESQKSLLRDKSLAIVSQIRVLNGQWV